MWWNVADDDGSRANDRPLTDHHSRSHDRSDPDECAGAHPDMTREVHAGREVNVIADHAVVVHGRSGVDNGVTTDLRVWLDDRPCK